ncbi:hypothetical protein LL962_14695 [Xanthomonas sp. NCPPB 1067]|uniref:hypothetical protein n=1 Tax=Xanthomonas sp. NCPPB 1067 TaxID=487524 RepID=UPI001E360F77|nr:hypothetical protein [Xanthomonas sp. NCPPB 1067]MCC4588336.1 hypothetical protein [Xanthomonas sp. NCPPB 1067]
MRRLLPACIAAMGLLLAAQATAQPPSTACAAQALTRAAKPLVSHVGSAGARMRMDAADRTDGLPMGQQILDDAELRIDQAR